jgi:ATP-binding cassette subfamily C exporter for protease/lipase
MLDLRQRGKTIVLITHRTSAIGATNKLLVLRDGAAQMFGPTQQVLAASGSQEPGSSRPQAQPAAAPRRSGRRPAPAERYDREGK